MHHDFFEFHLSTLMPQLSLEGCVINDSHAEIVTRRCMVVYLYSQLELLTVDDEAEREKSIFQKSADDSELHE